MIYNLAKLSEIHIDGITISLGPATLSYWCKISPKERREGEANARAARPQWLGIKPGISRVLGKSQYLPLV